jgi:hypothetical protein
VGRINLRKKLLINKKFQLSIIVWFVLLGAVISAIYYTSNLYFYSKIENEALAAGLTSENVFFQYLQTQKMMMNKLFFISVLVSTSIIAIVGLYLSNQIAGPVYRLTEQLKVSSKNNLKIVKFRKNDYFLELEKAFNDFVNRD